MTADHLGSPRITTDANGQVISRRDFQPFGEEIARAGYGGDDVRQKFTTYERDDETELDYAQARFYSATRGRFYSVDPENAGAKEDDAQSWNAYAYSRNNPVLFSDPNGLEYKVCNAEGQCWTHSDAQIIEAQAKGGFVWQGGQNGRTGLRFGIILDSDGNQVGAYQQTSHDNPIQQMLWGGAMTLEIWNPVIEFFQPMPIPGGSALPSVFKIVNGVRKAAPVVRRALPVLQKMCFVAGTPILTEKGLVPIEEIREGDKVLSFNEKTKQTEYKAVIQTMVRKAEMGRVWSLKVAGEADVLGVTREHPFYVRVHGARRDLSSDDEGVWVEVGDLQVGDEILKADGTWAIIESVLPRAESATVYNFEVADNHNYFVGRTSLLVHNADCQKLFNALIRSDRNGLTWIGRALEKHSNRAGSAFRTSAKNPKSFNEAGEELAEEILTNPSSRFTPNRFGGTDVRLPDGRGIRFDANGAPYSLLEP